MFVPDFDAIDRALGELQRGEPPTVPGLDPRVRELYRRLGGLRTYAAQLKESLEREALRRDRRNRE